ncbi:hypothetical protein GH721_08980 [Kriegella sp. EG-1]|nr:hypothetical protein [Flavobacteriaceae bacterium EG-1]
MNYLINGNLFKLSAVLVVLSAIMMTLVKKLRQLFTRNKLKAIVYALVVMLSFAIIGLLSSTSVLNGTPLTSFIVIQFFFLGLGILHLWILRRFFPSLSEKKSDFISEFLFSLIYTCLGLLAFFQVLNKFRPSFSYVFAAGAFFFMIPTLVYKMYEFALLIPVAIFKTWKYPLGEDVKDPSEEELQNPIIISFEFRKNINDLEITNFRVKAPKNMKFSTLFYFFIEDYNERHPESKIEFLESKSKIPYEWSFYLKPKFLGGIKYVDFDKTIALNKIKENTEVICKRVSNLSNINVE